jgi:hypothetical protein
LAHPLKCTTLESCDTKEREKTDARDSREVIKQFPRRFKRENES